MKSTPAKSMKISIRAKACPRRTNRPILLDPARSKAAALPEIFR
jgi:hypothetical protein